MRTLKVLLSGVLLAAALVIGTSAASADPAGCTQPTANSVQCTIEAQATPNTNPRNVRVRVLGQTPIDAVLPAVNTPDTQTVVATVTQAVPVVGHTTTECTAQINLGGGNANISVTVDGQPLAQSDVVIPATGEVASIDVCEAPSEP